MKFYLPTQVKEWIILCGIIFLCLSVVVVPEIWRHYHSFSYYHQKRMVDELLSFDIGTIHNLQNYEAVPFTELEGKWVCGETRHPDRLFLQCEESPFLQCKFVIYAYGYPSLIYKRKAAYIREKGVLILDKPMFNQNFPTFQLLKVAKNAENFLILQPLTDKNSFSFGNYRKDNSEKPFDN